MNEETIFAAALELPSAERSAYLAKACGADAAKRKRLEGLLAASDRAGNFMARPAVEVAQSPNAATEFIDGEATPQDVTITRDGSATPPVELDEDLGFLKPPSRPDSLGRIGHYEVLQVLGKGGFGIVFRAFDDVLQRVVAIKVMAPQLAATSPARKRFLREARSSAQVRHENVVQVYEIGEQPLPYLAMEFIPGETLQQRLDKTGPLDVPEVLRIGRQIAEGLAAAHATDLIHRDIKPSNVLIEGGPQQRVKITDFGLARAADDASISQSGIIAGTPMYMAPEQALGHKLDQRADLFSLGSVLYQMAAGRAPFRANSTVAVLKRVAEDTPRDIREIIPETPQWLCDIISKLHAKNPDERFQTAREVTDVLADCEAQLKAHAKVTDLSRIPRGKTAASGRRKWVAAALMLLALAAGVLAIIAIAVTMFWITDASESVNPAVPPPLKRAAWGEVVDPLGNSQLSETDDRLTITVPGDQSYDLNPLPNFNLSAPRVLKAIEGDFEARVTVLPFPRPKAEMGIRPEAAYVGAGLVVWQDDTCFLRLFRAGMGHNDGGAPYVHVEWFAAGKHEQKSVYVGDGPLHLRIRCTGGILHLSHSPDGRAWTDPVPPVVDLPLTGRVRVGVAAVNALNRDYTARFEGFEIKELPPGKSATTPPSETGWVQLFNGKDKTGWKTQPDQAGHWEVKDGILIGSSRRSFLFSERGDYVNFHLRVEAKINLGGDSGICFRAPFALRSGKLAWQVGAAGCYEAILNKNLTSPNPTGSVLELVNGERPIVLGRAADDSLTRPDEWFTLEIIAEQNRFITKVNGKETANCSDPLNKYLTGHIALQVFSPNTVVQFRKIEIKELPTSPLTPQKQAGEEAAKLNGQWVVRQGRVDQEPLVGQVIAEMKLTLTDGKFVLPIRDDSGYPWALSGNYTIDAAKQQLAFKFNHEPLDTPAVLCTYRLEGDKLALDFPEPKSGDRAAGSTELFVPDQRITSQRNLKNLGVAMHNYMAANKEALPQAAITNPKDGKPLLSWRVALLPHLELGEVYKQFKLDEPWDSEHNKKLIDKMPKIYAVPGAAPPPGHTHYQVFVGVGTAFEPRPAGAKGLNFLDFKDGLSNTILVVEAADPIIWTKPDDLAYDPKKPLPRLGVYKDGAHLLMGDGSVWRLSPNATEKGIRGAIDRDGGEVISPQLLRRVPWRGPALYLELQRRAPEKSLAPTFKNGIGMEFVIVPKGKSWLGGGKDKMGDKEVEIPADFYLGKYEVTQEEWEKVMGENPSHFSRTGEGKDAVKDIPDADLKRFPVENVSWDQCQIFVAKLNKLEKESGWVYRLPTEKEWEYSCRGGPMADKLDSAFDFYFAKPTNILLPQQANFDLAELKRTCKVGSYGPNVLGLTEMHGNVWEWCEDGETAADGSAHRVGRGGCWSHDPPGGRAGFHNTVPQSIRYYDLGLRLARVPSGVPAPEAKTPPVAVAPFTDADVKRIAALPAAEQVEEVRKELMRRNPGFDGRMETRIEDGVVTEFSIVTDTVTDIAPIRVFDALRVLKCCGTWTGSPKGLLADLTPLAGMKLANLTYLDLAYTKVNDARMVYFKDCKGLTDLRLEYTRVGDAGLEHFKDCKNLTSLNLAGTNVSDAGLALFEGCNGLFTLGLWDTQVGNTGLAHFKGCKNLENLWLGRTQVGDAALAQFKAMPLRVLSIDATGITDLTPLQGMALEDVRLTPKNITKGLNILRDMKSLKAIAVDGNRSSPVAEFWERYDKGEFGFAPFGDADVKRIAALPAAEQVEEVRKELVRRNPGFDGKVEHKIEGDVVTELRISTDKVTDISPIRVFNTLRVLDATGTEANWRANGQLADLTPLKGMNLTGLTQINLRWTKVGDAGMAHFKDSKNLVNLLLTGTLVGDTGLAHFRDCKDLTELWLDGTKVSDAGLAHFKDCKKLSTLYLHVANVGDAGLVHFKDCKDLTELWLSGTKVSDAGLAHFKDCKNLAVLHLDGTKVNDAGLVHFKDCKKLRTIWLDGTQVTDAGLAHLAGLGELTKLILVKSKVTAAGVEMLAKALPKCTIEWDGGVLGPK